MKTFQTRAKYLREIAKTTETYPLNDYMNHPSNRVRRAATRRIAHLERKQLDVQQISLPPVVPARLEFEHLVERFTREGKPNPEKSARASLARKAQLAKKVAPSFDGGF